MSLERSTRELRERKERTKRGLRAIKTELGISRATLRAPDKTRKV